MKACNFSSEVDEDDTTEKTKGDISFQWRHHLYNIQVSRKIKQDSKNVAEKSDGKISYSCFDLQQVLDTPYTNAGELFYERRLS